MKSILAQVTRCVLLVTPFPMLTVLGALGQQAGPKSHNAPAQAITPEDRSVWTIKGADQCIDRARTVVGLLRQQEFRAEANVVSLTEDNTPFLSELITGRQIWHVVVRDWKLKLKSIPPNSEDLYARTFDIYLDPQNGRVLKLISRWPEAVPPIAPEPGATSATDQLRRAGNERYLGFPPSDPAITFLDALDGVVRGGGNPLTAKQIVGQYVLWSRVGYEKPRAVWAITLRGIPVYEAAYPGVPVDARNHLRYIVDAETGEWVCANSTPQPDESRPGDE